jgi:hypothetical protein
VSSNCFSFLDGIRGDIPVHAKVEATSSPSYSASGQTVPVSPSSPGASSTSNDARFFWFLISYWFGYYFLIMHDVDFFFSKFDHRLVVER